MKRTCFGLLLLKGIGYVILGNVLCAIMTTAMFVFGSNFLTKSLSIAFSAVIFWSLIFTFGLKEGAKEHSLVKYKRVQHKLKYRALFAGFIMFLFAAAPSAALLINKLLFPEHDILTIYQFVSGSSFPFVQAFIPTINVKLAWQPTSALRINNMHTSFPALMCAYYLLIPAITQLGFHHGYGR